MRTAALSSIRALLTPPRVAPFINSRRAFATASQQVHNAPLVSIQNATFYRHHPSTPVPNPPLFSNLTFQLPSSEPVYWALISPSSTIRTTFLHILRGQLLCSPPTARSYPLLQHLHRTPDSAIQYVGFDAERRSYGGAYLSARYESLVETTDFSLRDYLRGNTNLNPSEEELRNLPDERLVKDVMERLELDQLVDRPVTQLSNGQGRRARIGKAVLKNPELLCLDAPFMGLDPAITKHMSEVLRRLAEERKPRVLMSLRPQDQVPAWITHLVYAGSDGVVQAMGKKDGVLVSLQEKYEEARRSSTSEVNPDLIELGEACRHIRQQATASTITTPKTSTPIPPAQSPKSTGEPLIEMTGVTIHYPHTTFLDTTVPSSTSPGLHWTISRSQRWALLGPNGSGKTTLLSLLTSDHPQAYSAPIRIFGRWRLPSRGEIGVSYFDIQKRIGQASPEVHALFPKTLSLRRALESAWAETPILKPKIGEGERERVERCLRWFERELRPEIDAVGGGGSGEGMEWADEVRFSALSLSAQRVVLFLRAFIKMPDLLVLDEAFSGMDDVARDNCMAFLEYGEGMEVVYGLDGKVLRESEVMKRGDVVVEGLKERQALVVVSHVKEEVPECVREWIFLPRGGKGEVRMGVWETGVSEEGAWEGVWQV
ncbi:P-loop containing nucleoside triphosphate hydrolase protein [Sporormia fimetaria CBS 119925]|uniref:P-loop containing nucleoside triphosphate hydrolase protein n=1 Tax=Sporormia fimetaria CBS 119925 TaxID=1340428 RepID=A0A6A6VHT0_9PLEO|nr:P-loop containing nucleoside triphosphate hydrolase protein [Sporormia fimetaria CBS 119925]